MSFEANDVVKKTDKTRSSKKQPFDKNEIFNKNWLKIANIRGETLYLRSKVNLLIIFIINKEFLLVIRSFHLSLKAFS